MILDHLRVSGLACSDITHITNARSAFHQQFFRADLCRNVPVEPALPSSPSRPRLTAWRQPIRTLSPAAAYPVRAQAVDHSPSGRSLRIEQCKPHHLHARIFGADGAFASCTSNFGRTSSVHNCVPSCSSATASAARTVCFAHCLVRSSFPNESGLSFVGRAARLGSSACYVRCHACTTSCRCSSSLTRHRCGRAFSPIRCRRPGHNRRCSSSVLVVGASLRNGK